MEYLERREVLILNTESTSRFTSSALFRHLSDTSLSRFLLLSPTNSNSFRIELLCRAFALYFDVFMNDFSLFVREKKTSNGFHGVLTLAWLRDLSGNKKRLCEYVEIRWSIWWFIRLGLHLGMLESNSLYEGTALWSFSCYIMGRTI